MASNYILYEITKHKRNGELELKCLGEFFAELPREGDEVNFTLKSEIEHWKTVLKYYKVEKVVYRYTETENKLKKKEMSCEIPLVYLKPIKSKSRRMKK